mmetsp:Transcript_73/g.149  ORF Transcript_73/g.149 Transcript_73/m.149 type:complete len:463 (+) Transcript_73:235-1623(+)
MSGFGGGGGGGRGGGRGRGRGNRGGGRGGGGGYHQRHDNMAGGQQGGPPPKFKPCSDFTQTGSCPRGHNCSFHHVVQLHAQIDASTPIQSQQSHQKNNYRGGYNQQNQNRMTPAPVSSIGVWQTDNMIKIFTGSHDGFWRLWNASAKFVKEFEHNMSGKVETLEVASNFLFCGFEGTCMALPNVKVGMIHAWNLSAPNNPPLEFHMHNLAPYAHASAVSIVKVVEGDKILSGDRHGTIRVWQFQVDKFVLSNTLHGHIGEITGLTAVDNMVWSTAATDQTIRLWDLSKNGECQHVIPSGTNANAGGANNPQQGVPNGAAAAGAPSGHTGAITSLLPFKSSAGSFVLSSSLDGTVKAWNSTDGACVHTESHGSGVVSMALSADQKNHPILLVGLESGNIMARNVMQTPNAPAFCLLFSLNSRYTAGHTDGPCRAIKEGPSATFYTGGDDGKLLVWQLIGDLGL